MADVFLARWQGPEGVSKRLVLKRILPMLASDPGFLDLFVFEARIAVALTHANIVPVFDFGRIGQDYFLAMEYVEGRDLGAIMARARTDGRPLSPALAAHVAAEVARALDYAHRRKVIHRDVAPRNVLVSTEGEVRLADFGVAHRGEQAHGQVRGTLTYMAPEQARAEQVDARADLFALGMVLLEALSGQRPREHEDPAAALAAARAGEVPPVPADTPTALASIVSRATAVDVAGRYDTAREMLEELEAYLRTEPASARALADELANRFDGKPAAPVGPVPDTFVEVTDEPEATYLGGEMSTTVATPKRPRSRRWAAAATALALAGAIGVVLFLRGDPPEETPIKPPESTARRSVQPDTEPPPPATPTKRPAPPQLPSAERAPVRKPPAGKGTLKLNANPWATVTIDGKSYGETPLVGVSLPAGIHRVRLETPQLGVTKRIVIEIKAGRETFQIVPMVP